MGQGATTLTAWRARRQARSNASGGFYAKANNFDHLTARKNITRMRATMRELHKGIPGLEPGGVLHRQMCQDLVSLRQAIFEYLKGCQNDGGTNT